MNVLTIIYAILGMASLVVHYRFAVTVLILSSLLATAAALSLPGGQTVAVVHFYLAFFIIRTYMKTGPARILESLRPPRPGFFLALLALYGVFSVVIILPFMTSKVYVYVLSEINGVPSFVLAHLLPTGGNINQLIYLFANFFAFCCSYTLFRHSYAYKYAANALIILTALNVMMAFIDLATWAAGTADVLSIIKTANFAYLDADEINGVKRISGSFAEASAFAAFTLRLFALCTSLWIDQHRPKITGVLALVSLALLVMSTSTTAYIGLVGALAIVIGSNVARSIQTGQAPKRMTTILAMALAGVVLVMTIAAIRPSAFRPIVEFIDSAIFNKISSSSGQERSAWNAQAIQIFFDTYGLGAGVGSTRASSSLMALLSNVGLLGTLLYAAFASLSLAARYRPELDVEDRIIVRACRLALLSSLFAQLFTAGTIDMGILNAVLFGLSASVAQPRFVSHLTPVAGSRLGLRPSHLARASVVVQKPDRS